jgi:hypothetical protein
MTGEVAVSAAVHSTQPKLVLQQDPGLSVQRQMLFEGIETGLIDQWKDEIVAYFDTFRTDLDSFVDWIGLTDYHCMRLTS